jgi:hypothetical protein
MAGELRPIDISDTPELLRLAEEVRNTNEPRVLRRNSEDLAIVMPIPKSPTAPRAKKTKTAADYAAFRSAAGGWKGLVDTDKLVEDIYESRRISTRPPVEL